MTHTTYADHFLPETGIRATFYNVVLILSGSLLLALSAKISFPIPFSPVPVTLQTFAVLLIGALFGSKRGALTVLAYLGEGAMGLPVFTKGGAGLAYFMGPTGGYLVGFVFAAYITGYLAERGWDRRISMTALAMAIGTITIFAFGVAWLAFLFGIDKAFVLGFFPFVPGGIIKIAAAAALLPSGWKLLRWLK